MASEYMSETVHNKERTRERVAIYLGRLEDFGLGNPEGIPSKLAEMSDEELQEYAEHTLEALKDPTDLRAFHCIDGRDYLRNADGSAPEVRLRHISGTESDLAIALNGEASVTKTLNPESSITDQAAEIDGFVAQVTGVEASGHLGGCGGANGEVDDQHAIHEQPAVMGTTKKLMEHPIIGRYVKVGHEVDFPEGTSVYDDKLGMRVQEQAGKTAAYLADKGWNGQAVVDHATKANPRGFADLKVGHDAFHGHAEDFIALILGDKTLDLPNVFVWNAKGSKMIAEALVGNRGAKGYAQILIADFAKHLATSSRLASQKTPILVLADFEF